MLRIGVLVSGTGTNLRAIMEAIDAGQIPAARIVVVLSNRSKAPALERARSRGIPAYFVSRRLAGSRELFEERLLALLEQHQVQLVLLAGFMAILSPRFVKHYPNRIMNIHPALLPAFGGPGFYGIKVHEAVLAAGVKITGATVHFVTPEVDNGPIILQRAVPVRDDDTPETLQRRVLEEAEWRIYPEAVRLFAQGRLRVEGWRVRILPPLEKES